MAASRKFSPFLSACLNAFCLGGLLGLGDLVKIQPEVTFNTNRESKNGKKLPDGVEIRFPGHIPSNEVRNQLKKLGFKFSEKQQLWYAYDNEETRAFVNQFQTQLVDANTYTAPEGEKNWFWAKVRSLSEYEKVPEQAAIKVVSDEGTFYYKNKAHFTGTYRSPSSLVQAGKVFFKKFFTRKSEAEENDDDDDGSSTSSTTVTYKSTRATKPNSSNNEAIAERLFDMAQSMQKAIDHKMNPPIANQRLTRRRANIASSMRSDGVRLMKIQIALYSLAWAWKSGTISSYAEKSKAIGNLRSKEDIKSIIWKWNADKVPTNLQKIGIGNDAQWETAQNVLNDLMQDFREHTASTNPNRANSEKLARLFEELKQLERDLIGAKIPGFFPTPLPLIKNMLSLANIQEGDTVLEPSAGKGDICDAILDLAEEKEIKGKVSIIAVEQYHSLVKIIEKRKEIAVTDGLPADTFKIKNADFLSLSLEHIGKVDKVVMNPPFEGGIDIIHIMSAAAFLKPRGKLVAVISEGSLNRSYQKERLFRTWLYDLADRGEAYISEAIPNAFNTASSFRQTGVTVRIISITCPESGRFTIPNDLFDILSGKKPGNKPVKPTPLPPSTTFFANNDIEEEEILELEAIAQIEILKLANANAKAKGLKGIGSRFRAGNTAKSLLRSNKQRLTNFQKRLLSL